MTWNRVYNQLSDAEKMIIDIADDNRIDLTDLANLQVQKQEINTHMNEVNYGTN